MIFLLCLTSLTQMTASRSIHGSSSFFRTICSLSHFPPVVFIQLLSHVSLFVTPWTAAPGSSVLHCLPEFAQIHVHWVSDAIQPAHPLSPHFSCPQSFPASESFPMSRLFASRGQSTGASASASALPMNIQGRFPLGLTGWISLLSKRLSRVFSNTTVQKHQFFGAQSSLWSNSHIHRWWALSAKWCLCFEYTV